MRIKRLGWRRDLPDVRDYGVGDRRLPQGFRTAMVQPFRAAGVTNVEVDMIDGVSRIVDQDTLGSCTGHGVIGIHEFLDKKTHGHFTPLSRLFMYKATRNFMGLSGDTGAEIRSAMGALVLFGCPPEEFYPYEIAQFDLEPASFHYALAANYKGTQYARLDVESLSRAEVLDELKGALLHGWPFVFGFTVYESFEEAASNGAIAFPGANGRRERITGGHCMYATGFSDTYDKCRGAAPGAFSGPNSWGTGWGDHGRFWIPYDYVLRGLLVDCWTLTKADWIDPEPFK